MRRIEEFVTSYRAEPARLVRRLPLQFAILSQDNAGLYRGMSALIRIFLES
jgi:hypothetical protein